MTQETSIEYRLIPHIRYSVTRWYSEENGGGCEEMGEYANPETAFAVGYALCRAEHERLGWPLGDERIRYPENPAHASAVAEMEL